jgi:hypothetical protein
VIWRHRRILHRGWRFCRRTQRPARRCQFWCQLVLRFAAFRCESMQPRSP